MHTVRYHGAPSIGTNERSFFIRTAAGADRARSSSAAPACSSSSVRARASLDTGQADRGVADSAALAIQTARKTSRATKCYCPAAHT
jgi:hypothetical protein